jgi:hypothetical protein
MNKSLILLFNDKKLCEEIITYTIAEYVRFV